LAVEGEVIIKKAGSMMGIREDKVATTAPIVAATVMTKEMHIIRTELKAISIMIEGRLKGSIIVVNAATPVIGTDAVNSTRTDLKAEVEVSKKDAPQSILRLKTANQKSKFFLQTSKRNHHLKTKIKKFKSIMVIRSQLIICNGLPSFANVPQIATAASTAAIRPPKIIVKIENMGKESLLEVINTRKKLWLSSHNPRREKATEVVIRVRGQ